MTIWYIMCSFGTFSKKNPATLIGSRWFSTVECKPLLHWGNLSCGNVIVCGLLSGSIQTSTFGPPSAVGRGLSGYFEFKHTNIMLMAITKRPFSDGPKYQHLQIVMAVSNGHHERLSMTAVSNGRQRCLNWSLVLWITSDLDSCNKTLFWSLQKPDLS
jgi:hypothetical protein